MFFCPNCGNLLLLEQDIEMGHHMACQTCEYRYGFTQKIRKSSALKLKTPDEAVVGNLVWEKVPIKKGLQLQKKLIKE